MKIKVPKRKLSFEQKYHPSDLKIARKFAKKIYKELGNFIVALTLFGSTVKGTNKRKSDIDILIIIDDIKIILTKDLIETYRIVLAKVVANVNPKKLHVQTMTLSSFWEYIRAGDPVAMNILRDSIALIDTGFFDPLQILLDTGRIRPTSESIWTYYTMAPSSIQRAKGHIDMAIVDLYWAAIDSAHAALMSLGEIPPSPDHAAQMIHEKMVVPGYVSDKYSQIMKHIYEVAKKLMHREISGMSGADYDRYARMIKEFVHEMKRFIESKNK